MSEATVQAPEINFSIFKNLTIVFLVLNAGFLYLIYATFMGVDIGLFNITEFAAHANAHVMLHIHALAAILGGSYVFMITKHYGVSLTLAVLPQFAFIGALGGVLL